MRCMPTQFWNPENTRKSYDELLRLAKDVDLVLIGGWAVYLYTNAQRSADVDIAIGYDAIGYFRQFGIDEYEGIKVKYSDVRGTTVDLFIDEYSDADLPFPVSEIRTNYITINGIKVVRREMLLLLKLWGYFRIDETKHRKDVIDVVSLLFYAHPEIGKAKEYVSKYKIEARKSSDAMLEYLDKGETMWEYITESKGEYARLKDKVKREIKDAFYSGDKTR